MKKPEVETVKIIWADRKRHLGLPLSFTRYSMSEDRIFIRTGFLNIHEDEIQLYRVKDVSLSRSLAQRLFRVGTVCVKSSDVSVPHLDVKNVAYSQDLKELINQRVEAEKKARRMRATEILDTPEVEGDGEDDTEDSDGDGIPDDQE